jgi:hypothetical protein
MAYSVQQIKFEIYRYIKEYDSDFNNWYIGISENPKKTINIDHNIDLENGIWLYKQALTFTACKTIQKYFIQNLNMAGELVEFGNENMDCVFIYKK